MWSSPARRSVYLALWVPNGLIVGCEAIFVAYAPNSAAALFVAAVASLGYSAGLLLQERLIALTPDAIRGQALGLHSAGMRALQACRATLAGASPGSPHLERPWRFWPPPHS